MKSFAKLTKLVNLKIDLFTVFSILLLSLLIAYPFLLWQWYIGLPISIFLISSTLIMIGK
jgi:hypothetical protein